MEANNGYCGKGNYQPDQNEGFKQTTDGPQSEITRLLTEIGNRLDDVDTAFGKLKCKIGPVVAEEKTGNGIGNLPNAPIVLSPLGIKLNEILVRINRNATDMSDLYPRVVL